MTISFPFIKTYHGRKATPNISKYIHIFFNITEEKQEKRINMPVRLDVQGCFEKFLQSAPILSPSMNGFNHLREQCTNTVIDEILEKMYRILIIQVQPKFLLKLNHKKKEKREQS